MPYGAYGIFEKHYYSILALEESNRVGVWLEGWSVQGNSWLEPQDGRERQSLGLRRDCVPIIALTSLGVAR